MAVGNIANTLGTATGVWSNGQLVAGEPNNQEATSFATMTPQQYLQYLTQLGETPMGQAAQRAQQQTAAMNIKQALAAIEQGRRQLEIQAGTAKANAWAQQQQVKLAQQAHALAVQTQQQNYEIASGNLTGTFQGQPTLAAIGQQALYSGTINGQPTLQAQNQAQQFGLQQGGLLGTYNGQQTLPALQNQQQYGLNLGALTGVDPSGNPTLAARQQNQQNQQNWANILGYDPSGTPTLQNQQFVTGATGYYGGASTLAREQAAANTSLQAGQLAASLQGPGNWARFLQAQNGVNGSAASNLVASVPGGLGASAGPNPPPLTLASVLGNWGVAPQSGAGVQHGQTVFAGGTPGFNEATGQYVPGQQAYTPAQQQQWAAQADPRTQQQAWWQQQNAGNPYVQQSGASGRGSDAGGAGGSVSYAENGANAGGWNPQSPVGALGQVMNAPRVTNAQLGLTDQEAGQLQGYFQNPGSAPSTWWSSKDQDQKDYLSGLDAYWGGSPTTFQARERNSRPRQAYAGAA